MKRIKGFSTLAGILVVVGIIIIAGAVWYAVPYQDPLPRVVGGDQDVHGCIGSAGYAWCEAKQKCMRAWEEYCGPSNLDQAFAILTGVRDVDSGVFGYATSSAFEWRLSGDATTTLQGVFITASGAHHKDYAFVQQYFTDHGLSASIPNEAGGPTGGLQGYQKGSLACVVAFTYTDVTQYADRPIQVNSDVQNITVSCGVRLQ